MKFIAITCVFLCVGCATTVQPTVSRDVVSAVAIETFAQPLLVLEQSSDDIVPFKYLCPMTNCYLQSSTDLVNWQYRYDFTVETNIDGTTNWRMPRVLPYEFYRIGGDTLR